MARKKGYQSPSTCLSFPNGGAGARLDENYCRAHIRFGQNTVDAWGAMRRRSLSQPASHLMTHSCEFDRLKTALWYEENIDERRAYSREYKRRKAEQG